MMPRRDFLKGATVSMAALGLAGTPVAAIEPFKRPGTPRLQLSLAAYSFRQFFKDASKANAPEPAAEKRIDLFQFIDYCADHGCAGTELTSYYFPKDFDEAYLIRLRRHAFLRGVAVSGTAVGNTFTLAEADKRDAELANVRKWVDRAAVLGAPHIRVFAGNLQKGSTAAEAKALAISALEECGDYAGRKGVFLGLENHGGIVADPKDLLEIVKAVKSPWVGINLDTGNFHTDDPYADLASCAPYAVNVQVKSEIQKRGQKKELADLARLVKILRDANYQGFVALEYEAAEDPWQAVPPLLRQLRELMG
ncbi:MAG TPA: sugar phosphate isomerase/epimerase family protein [Verrucomicrobiae bacterium]|nr:sugar phosphate isomerase/epimerase family protein [Verrucomicrobiae bacterium]